MSVTHSYICSCLYVSAFASHLAGPTFTAVEHPHRAFSWLWLTYTKQMSRRYVERRANTPHLGTRGFTPVAAQLHDRGFERRRRKRYVIGKRDLFYRHEESKTAQVQNIGFFIYALVYLLLDLEVLLIFPFTVSEYVNNIYGLFTTLIFIFIITIGFVFELGKGALKISTKQNMEDLSLKNNIISISYLNRIFKKIC